MIFQFRLVAFFKQQPNRHFFSDSQDEFLTRSLLILSIKRDSVIFAVNYFHWNHAWPFFQFFQFFQFYIFDNIGYFSDCSKLNVKFFLNINVVPIGNTKMVFIFFSEPMTGSGPSLLLVEFRILTYIFFCRMFDNIILVRVEGFSLFSLVIDLSLIFIAMFSLCVDVKKGFAVSQNFLLPIAPLIVDCSK